MAKAKLNAGVLKLTNPVGSHPNVQNPRRRRPRAHKGTPDQAQVELIQSLQII